MDYSDIKLKHLHPIRAIIENEDLDAETKDFQILNLITGISVDKLDALDFKISIPLRRGIQFLYQADNNFRLRKYIFVRGTWYKLLTDVRSFSAGRNLSIKAALANGGVDKNFARIASLCYKPLFRSNKITADGNYEDLHPKRQNKITKDFEEVKVSKVAGGVFFYLNVSLSLKGYMTLHLMNLHPSTKTD